MKAILSVDREGWKRELGLVREHYARFGDRLPAELLAQLEALEQRLS